MSADDVSLWDPCATISTFLSLSDIAKASLTLHRQKSDPVVADNNGNTPVLRLLSDLRAKGYQRPCMSLTNERWKARWEGMCLLPAESADEDKERAARDAEAWRMMPGFMKDEVTITSLGMILILSICFEN